MNVRVIARSLRSVGVTAAFAGATLVLGAGPAFAGTDARARAGTPVQWYADGMFVSHGDSLTVCDTYGDGRRAYAEITYRPSPHGSEITRTVEDANGANNGKCASEGGDIAEGTGVVLKVCVRNGSGGALEECNADWGSA